SYFPGPSSVFLLVKPFATKVSLAGFFFREEGKVHAEAPYQEFPFRRRELGGGAAPARTPPVRLEAADLEAADRPVEEPFDPTLPAPREDDQIPAFAQPEFQASRFRTGNVWIPLSFLFLLLGVLVGFQAAMTYRPARAAGILSDPYSVSLAASRSGDYLHVRWDRHSQPVRTAQRGVLTIIEGTYDKKVDLDVLQLQNPAVYYRNMSDVVKFRLDLYTKENVAVSETLEWRK
ncbi:MAG TPA: hypothetical protein VM120_12195, partial [Bryobacteraceae bacterium]|nr:hypothetical protein [Bryobacteraceae bacterium]